jgi:hypothetical protein
MIYIMSVIFPLIAMGCSIWIFIAMISYVSEIRRDIKSHK